VCDFLFLDVQVPMVLVIDGRRRDMSMIAKTSTARSERTLTALGL
jgi:hypothetical protein